MLSVFFLNILTLPWFSHAESESVLDGATCAPYVTNGFHAIYPCENLIDKNGLSKNTNSDGKYVMPDFTYKLDGVKGIT